MKRQLPIWLVLLLSTALNLSATVLTNEHTDIGLGYEGGEWDLHIHDEDNDEEYEPDEAVLYAGPAARKSANSFEAGFTGAAQGEDLWVLPQSQNGALLYLGVGTEVEEPTDFGVWLPSDSRITDPTERRYFRLNLESVSGPGFFSVYTYSDTDTVWMSTYSEPTDGNYLYTFVPGHGHFNWAFTEIGMYEVTFSVTAELANGDMVTSGPATYFFGVETVPEPATGSLLLLAGLGLLHRRRQAKNGEA